MIPAAFTNFFLASTGAAAALVGLLFVAISVNPEQAQHALAQRLLRGFGGMLSFTVKGDTYIARDVVDHLKLAMRAGSLGDADTLASLPVLTSHRLMSPQDRAATGVTDTLIRVSVGLENSADIINDFISALDTVQARFERRAALSSPGIPTP